MKTHFITGLPRSGSTLLCNILAQNPRFHVSSTSALCDMLVEIRNRWDQLPENRAMPASESEHHKVGFLRGAFHGYHLGHKDKICFDKSRSWLGHVELVESVLVPPPAKFIVCIRDVRDILTSLELLWRKTSALYQISTEREEYPTFQSLPGRLSLWMDKKGMVGLAMNRLLDACRRGYLDRMLFLDYDFLVARPSQALTAIHSFLEIDDDIAYNFEQVKPLIEEDDRAYDFPGLHHIRPKVEPNPSRWREVLGDYGEAYAAANELLIRAMKGPELNRKFRPRKVLEDVAAVNGPGAD